MNKDDRARLRLIEEIKKEAGWLTKHGYGGVRFTHSGLTADVADELFRKEAGQADEQVDRG